MCKHSDPLKNKRILLKCSHEYTEIEKINTAIPVNGRGYLSQHELESVKIGARRYGSKTRPSRST